jgi:hypothetical protein
MTTAELISELQAARPTADHSLRERIRAIATAEPPQRSSPFARLSLRRLVVVAVPATAVVAIAAAGVAGLLDARDGRQAVPEARTTLEQSAATQGQSNQGQANQGQAQQLAPAAKARAADAGTPTAPGPTLDRAQRYSAQLTIAVKDVDALSAATQRALQTTRDLGGFLVTASYATSGTGTSSLTLRIPTARVQDAIVRLSDLGRIVAQQVQIDDLQGQLDELGKRETALRGQIARLSARLAATNLDAATRATLEARRAAAQRDLAQVRSARTQVNGEARYATIQLTLQTEESSLVPASPSAWDRGVDRAGTILAVEAAVVLYGLVVLGPLVLIALAAWFTRRELRRRSEERLLSSP